MLFPEFDELQDFVVLLILAEVGVGVTEDTRLGVLGQKSEDSLLAAASFGDVVFLDEGIVAMERNGMEVEIKRTAMLQAAVNSRRVDLKADQNKRWINAAGVILDADPLLQASGQ